MDANNQTVATMHTENQTIAMLQKENQWLHERVAALEIRQDAAMLSSQWVYDILEQSNIPICLWHGDDYVYKFANQAYLTGTGKHDVIGKPLREVFDDEEIPGLMAVLDHVYTSGEMQFVPEALVRLNNPETGQKADRWFNLIYNPVRDNQGSVVGVSNFVIEVTTQVRAQQELYRQAQILDQVHGSVIVTDMEGTIISWNRDSTRIFGYEPAEAIGQSITIIYPPEQHERLLNDVIRPLQVQDTLEIETLAWNKAGQRFPLQLSLSLLRDESGTPIGMIGYSVDSSEHKRQEQALRQSQALLQAVFDNVPAIIYVRDVHGRFTLVNKQHAAALGYTPQDIIGRYDHDIFPPESMHGIRDLDQQVIDTSASIQQEETVPGIDGWRTYISTRFPLFDEQGIIYGIGGISTDITERKRQEQEHQHLVAVVETSSDFIGIASLEGQATYLNEAGKRLVGLESDAAVRQTKVIDYFPPEEQDYVQQEILPILIREGHWKDERIFRNFATGEHIPVEWNVVLIRDSTTGAPISFATVTRDLREQKRQEAEREALQQQIIDAQRDALRELSTPLIPVSDSVMIMPLIGTIDSQRAQMVMETLLEGVAQHQVDLVILDITGVRVVDTQVAQAFIQAAQAVRLLGAQVMLTGIQPQIAQTLVHLGVDLSGIITRGSLQAGIAAAFKH